MAWFLAAVFITFPVSLSGTSAIPWVFVNDAQHAPVVASLAVKPGGGSPTELLYTIRNPTDSSRRFIVWDTALEEHLRGDHFLFSSGVVARYTGVIAKRMQVITATNTFTIGPHSEHSKSIELSDYYKFLSGRSGKVRAEHALLEITDDLRIHASTISTNEVDFEISKDIEVAQLPNVMLPKPTAIDLSASCEVNTGGTCRFFGCHRSRGPTECFKGDGFFRKRCLCKPGYCAVGGACQKTYSADLNTNECSDDQRNIILTASEDAKLMVDCAIDLNGKDPKGYFGSDMAPARVGQVLKRVASALDTESYSVTCKLNEEICGDEGHTFACVYPTDTTGHQINLASAFWNAPRNSIGNVVDTQAGTLIHEMTHFDDIGDTDDLGYGNRILPPDKALHNADTFEYYCETCPAKFSGLSIVKPSEVSFLPIALGGMFAIGVLASLAVSLYRQRGNACATEPLLA